MRENLLICALLPFFPPCVIRSPWRAHDDDAERSAAWVGSVDDANADTARAILTTTPPYPVCEWRVPLCCVATFSLVCVCTPSFPLCAVGCWCLVGGRDEWDGMEKERKGKAKPTQINSTARTRRGKKVTGARGDTTRALRWAPTRSHTDASDEWIRSQSDRSLSRVPLSASIAHSRHDGHPDPTSRFPSRPSLPAELYASCPRRGCRCAHLR